MREAGYMRSRRQLITLLGFLVSLLVPEIASASTAASAETRVWGFEFADGVRAGVECSLTLELHRGCELAYDELASDSLLAPRGGASGRQLWGRAGTLDDHFRRHGADFGARNADDYV